MRETYDEAMQQVFADEGGYTNDANDSGGPTNFGITIHDARAYWKPDATAIDVRNMPRSVAEEIYRKHYADPINYDQLPPGVDYAVLDYGINSGLGRAIPTYQRSKSSSGVETINAIYDTRIAFLRGIVASRPSQGVFLKGWMARCDRGRKLALSLNAKYSKPSKAKPIATGTVIAAGAGAAATAPHNLLPWIIGGTVIAAIIVYAIVHYANKGK